MSSNRTLSAIRAVLMLWPSEEGIDAGGECPLDLKNVGEISVRARLDEMRRRHPGVQSAEHYPEQKPAFCRRSPGETAVRRPV